MKKQLAKILILLASVSALFTSCLDRSLREDAETQLRFSSDTVMFDTVFTQFGSATKRFKVRNPYDEAVKIARVQLREGDQSKFRFNINGYEGNNVQNVEIGARDSIFVFVEVTLDPNNESNPLIVEDAVQFITNGNLQEVTLTAWGQDAYYYVPTQAPPGFPALTTITERYGVDPPAHIVMPNDKPHVIFGYLMINEGIQLTIPAGTEIYFYAGSGLWAFKGSNLKVEGEKDDEVYFRGFRRESYYNTLPGQWDRIILNESPQDHEINYAVIENSFIGISAEYFYLEGNARVASNKLKLTNTIIQNTEGLGILSRLYNIDAENCLITNGQSRLMGIQGGGTFNFTHCTFGNYWRFGNRQDPSLFLSNAFEFDNNEYVNALDFNFNNSIIYGSNDEELEADTSYKDRAPWNVNFHHSAVRSDELAAEQPGWFTECVINPSAESGYSNPLFTSTEHKRDDDEAFYLHGASAAIGIGDPGLSNIPGTDLKGDARTGTPDAGAYEN